MKPNRSFIRNLIAILPPLLLCTAPFPSLADNTATAPSDPPTASTDLTGQWGEQVEGLQARLLIKGEITKGGTLEVAAELRNISKVKIAKKELRVWLMIAQGKSLVFYSAPFTADPKSIDPGESITIPLSAGDLSAFPYVADLELHDGLPSPKDPNAPAPKSVGKISDILPVGTVRARAFVVVSQPFDPESKEKIPTEVISSATLPIKVGDRVILDFDKMKDAEKKAFLADLTTAFHSDAVSAKAAHDQALNAGKSISPELVKLLSDEKLSSAGQMWLAATLVDLNDDRVVDPLIKILEKGGPAAQVVAYHGPKMKNPKLTAAIQKIAATTKDPGLTAWAARGLGIGGEKVDAKLLTAMVDHSDPLGRAEAAEIIAASPDPQSTPLLAKLIADSDPTVRLAAIHSALAHTRKEKPILDALTQAAQSPDEKTAAAAKDATQKLAPN